MKKICAGCGKEFEPNKSVQIYCSRKCKNKYGYKPRPLEKRICAVCGKEYETNISYQKYCSKECSDREKYYRAKGKLMKRKRSPPEPKPTARHCLACGSEYEPQFQGDKFCSDDCRMSWYRPEVINAIGKIFYARQ